MTLGRLSCGAGALAVLTLLTLVGVACAPAPPAPAAPPGGAAPGGGGQAGAVGVGTANAPAAGAGSAPTAVAVPTPQTVQHVTYGIAARSFSFLPSLLAERQGFYRQHGLEVEIQVMPPVTIAAGQISGSIHYGTGYIQAIRAGSGQLKLVSSQVTGPIFIVMGRPGIASITDLRGKTIGTGSRGAAIERETIKIVEHYGLVADRDVALLPFPETNILMQALVQGQVDAAALSPPWHTRARQQGNAVRLLAAADIDPEPQNGLVTTVERLRQNRDQVLRMVMAEIEALRFLRSQRAETEAVVSEWLALTPEEAREGYDAALPVMSLDGQLDRTGIARLIENEKGDGTVPADLTVDAVIEPTLAAEALRALDAAPRR